MLSDEGKRAEYDRKGVHVKLIIVLFICCLKGEFANFKRLIFCVPYRLFIKSLEIYFSLH